MNINHLFEPPWLNQLIPLFMSHSLAVKLRNFLTILLPISNVAYLKRYGSQANGKWG